MSITAFAPAALEPDDDTIVFDPITPESAALARAFVYIKLADMPTLLGIDAATVVSELIGNAVLHGGDRVTLTVHVTDEGDVEIEVADDGQRQRPTSRRPKYEHGRGLLIVRQLCATVKITRPKRGGTSVRVLISTPKEGRR